MKGWSIAILAAGVLAYGVMEAQRQPIRLDRNAAGRLPLLHAAEEPLTQPAM